MNLKEQELFDYITCPAYYDMKHNKKLGFTEEPTMSKLLNQIPRHFYSNMFNNKKICTMDDLKKKWDSICSKHKDFINSKRNLDGINYIINFARWNGEHQPIIADYGSSYIIEVEDTYLVGELSPVRVLPGKKCELLINRFSSREPEQYSIDKQLKYTLDCYAFKEAYNHDISAIKIIHHKNNKMFVTQRTQIDYDRMRSTIIGVSEGIKAKAYYPRESVFCQSCEMKQYCKYWS